MNVLLDTHMWVWWLTPESPLTRPERDALDASAGRRELLLPAISPWEVQVLHAGGSSCRHPWRSGSRARPMNG